MSAAAMAFKSIFSRIAQAGTSDNDTTDDGVQGVVGKAWLKLARDILMLHRGGFFSACRNRSDASTDGNARSGTSSADKGCTGSDNTGLDLRWCGIVLLRSMIQYGADTQFVETIEFICNQNEDDDGSVARTVEGGDVASHGSPMQKSLDDGVRRRSSSPRSFVSTRRSHQDKHGNDNGAGAGDDNDHDISDSESTAASLGSLLLSFGLRTTHIENLLLTQSREIFNSVASIDSDELNDAVNLLNLLPASSVSVRAEMAFHTLLQYLKQVGVIEMVPMQIRMMVLDGGMSQHQLGGARRLVEKVFELQPSAYWALVVIQEENDANPRNYDDGSSGHGENVIPLDKVVQLRNAPLPGRTLENVLLRALGLEDIQLTLEGSHISSGDGNVDRMAASVSIRIAFLSAALQHDDYMSVYCLARALLSTALQCADDEIVSLIQQSCEMLWYGSDRQGGEEGQRALCRALAADLEYLALASPHPFPSLPSSAFHSALTLPSASSSPSIYKSEGSGIEEILEKEHRARSAASLSELQVLLAELIAVRESPSGGSPRLEGQFTRMFYLLMMISSNDDIAGASNDNGGDNGGEGGSSMSTALQCIYAAIERLHDSIMVLSANIQSNEGEAGGVEQSAPLKHDLVNQLVHKGFSYNGKHTHLFRMAIYSI